MINNGFYLKELRVIGSSKKDAVVTFDKGLNVVCGASDTGKSYIFQCLYFMLGGSNAPQSLDKEDIGYDEVYLQIQTYHDQIYTLKRKLIENSYFIWNDNIDSSLKSADYKTYNLKQSKDGNNISSFLLSLINPNAVNLQLKKNLKGVLQSFTISSLKPFIMVDENKIISKESVFFARGYNVTSLELSSFRTLLTGLDDKECIEVESPDIKKAKIEGKIEFIQELINRSKERIEEKKINLDEKKSIELEKRIDELINIIADNSEIIQKKSIEKKELWDNTQKLMSKVTINEELLNRFDLLKATLTEDIERLSFIQESNHYVSQLVDANCPTCNAPISSDNEKDFTIIIKSCTEEQLKIKRKIDDLEITIEQMKVENEKLSKDINFIKQNSKIIDNEIESILKPIITTSRNELNYLQAQKEIKHDIEHEQTEENDYISKKNYFLELKVSGKAETDYKNVISETIYNDICSELFDILKQWNYSDLGEVVFNTLDNDFIINGKSRKSHGKGHRALLYSAFIIATLNYCKKENNNSLHPGFIILDSPLTSYKEADKEKPNEDDLISVDTEQKFFETLSKYKNKQIIIFDNKEPEDKIKNNIIYHHFSKNYSKGRYGFFPIN